ncbi:hypothetical protein, partial [Acinetobacter baumannii]|uniref:hypothetical protein n=1 Tax=Acinetobacter baumannii TaxID=470 RepID=UPI00148AD6B3
VGYRPCFEGAAAAGGPGSRIARRGLSPAAGLAGHIVAVAAAVHLVVVPTSCCLLGSRWW